MNKKLIVLVLAIVLLSTAVAAWSANSEDDAPESSESSMKTDSDDNQSMDSDDHNSMQSDDAMTAEDHSAMMGSSDDSAMAETSGKYISLADYQTDQAKYDDRAKVLFFHAGWCSICQSIDHEIEADPSKIPDNAVFIKTDFDSQTALRQKYGITTQYTFVQIDNDGNELKQWSATTLEQAVNGIQ